MLRQLIHNREKDTSYASQNKSSTLLSLTSSLLTVSSSKKVVDMAMGRTTPRRGVEWSVGWRGEWGEWGEWSEWGELSELSEWGEWGELSVGWRGEWGERGEWSEWGEWGNERFTLVRFLRIRCHVCC